MRLMIKSRNRTADLLKGIAVILMVQVHLIELFAQQQIFDSYIGSVLLFLGGPAAAPVFMTVMGYFIAKGKTNFSKSIIRGFKLIGGGLLLNFGLNLHLFIKIYNQTIVTSPWPYLFGVDILFLAGLSIIFLSLFQKLFKNKPLPYIIIIGLIFLIQLLPYPNDLGFTSYFNALFYSNVWWSYFPIIPWLAYPLTGYVFYLIEPKINYFVRSNNYKIVILGITGIILVVSISYGIMIAANLHVYYHHDAIYYIFVLIFMIFWSNLASIITSLSPNFFTGYIEWMGKNVTVFYVIQWLIIGNIATGLYKTQSGIQLAAWFLGILFLTSALTFLYTKVNNTFK